jgi:hypothetical protein
VKTIGSGRCLTALRILSHSKGPRRDILIEKNIDEYLRTDPFSLAQHLSGCADLSITKNLKGATRGGLERG